MTRTAAAPPSGCPSGGSASRVSVSPDPSTQGSGWPAGQWHARALAGLSCTHQDWGGQVGACARALVLRQAVVCNDGRGATSEDEGREQPGGVQVHSRRGSEGGDQRRQLQAAGRV